MSKNRKEVHLPDHVVTELKCAVDAGESPSVKELMEKIINDWAYERYVRGEMLAGRG